MPRAPEMRASEVIARLPPSCQLALRVAMERGCRAVDVEFVTVQRGERRDGHLGAVRGRGGADRRQISQGHERV